MSSNGQGVAVAVVGGGNNRPNLSKTSLGENNQNFIGTGKMNKNKARNSST